MPGMFTLKIEAFELSFRDMNVLARKEVTVQRRKFFKGKLNGLGLWKLKMYQSGLSVGPPFWVKWAL